MSQSSDDFYIRLVRGHPTAFEDVLAWYSDDVLRLATLLLKDPDEARDILQETMLIFVEEIKKKHLKINNGSLKYLLITIARNLCINRLKKNNRFVEFPEGCIENQPELTDLQTPLVSANELEFETSFYLALDRLSTMQRTVLVLHELQQDSFHEIAESLGMSYESVKKNFYRGLKKLRILLEPFNR